MHIGLVMDGPQLVGGGNNHALSPFREWAIQVYTYTRRHRHTRITHTHTHTHTHAHTHTHTHTHACMRTHTFLYPTSLLLSLIMLALHNILKRNRQQQERMPVTTSALVAAHHFLVMCKKKHLCAIARFKRFRLSLNKDVQLQGSCSNVGTLFAHLCQHLLNLLT